MSAEISEAGAVSACVICGHRVIWHHDERGCQYHGNGASRCPCRRNADQVVARLIHDALHRAGDQWADAIVTGRTPGADR